MKISRKAKAIVSVVVALLLVIFSFSLSIAKENEKDEPYGPAIQRELKIELPGGKTIAGGENSPGGGDSQGGGSSTGGGDSSDGAIKPGVKITISGGGFAPYAKYDIVWDGKVLIDPYADAKGYAYYEFTVPTSANSGIHTVSMQGKAASGGTLVLASNVVVKAKKIAKTGKRGAEKAEALPFTGGGLLLYALVAGIALTTVGFGMRLFLRVRQASVQSKM